MIPLIHLSVDGRAMRRLICNYMIHATTYVIFCEFSPVVADYLDWSTLSAVGRKHTHTDVLASLLGRWRFSNHRVKWSISVNCIATQAPERIATIFPSNIDWLISTIFHKCTYVFSTFLSSTQKYRFLRKWRIERIILLNDFTNVVWMEIALKQNIMKFFVLALVWCWL